MSDLFKDHLQIIVQRITGRRQRVSDDARLYHDLGISGDDAIDLINTINHEFGTSFDGFIFSLYFPSETESIYYNIFRLFGRQNRKKNLTFHHLLEVVRKGQWFEPEK